MTEEQIRELEFFVTPNTEKLVIIIREQFEQNKRLIEALKWYANEENYFLNDKNPLTPVEKDFGRRAKKSIQQIQGKET